MRPIFRLVPGWEHPVPSLLECLNAFYALKGKYADKKKLADKAIYLERNLCQEAGGWQDQIAASFGGFNRINFNADGYEVLPVIISPDRKKQLNKI